MKQAIEIPSILCLDFPYAVTVMGRVEGGGRAETIIGLFWNLGDAKAIVKNWRSLPAAKAKLYFRENKKWEVIG